MDLIVLNSYLYNAFICLDGNKFYIWYNYNKTTCLNKNKLPISILKQPLFYRAFKMFLLKRLLNFKSLIKK